MGLIIDDVFYGDFKAFKVKPLYQSDNTQMKIPISTFLEIV
jgi:hypothetical protein